MAKYIDNVNAYLSQMKIKQTFVSLKTGIDSKKLSRILTGAQDISSTDMEKIAAALGKKVEFFLAEDFGVQYVEPFEAMQMAFYTGAVNKKQQEFAMQMVELIENVDEVLGAKEQYLMTIGE